MVALEARARSRRRSAHEPFPRSHRWDRNFFLTYVVLIWTIILMGFTPDVIHHIEARETPYPLVVHVHAVVFVGWLVMLSVQTVLVRIGRADLHRRLGWAGAALAVAVVAMGLAASIVMDRRDLASAHPNPSFLSAQLLDLAGFAGASAAAILLRGDASAHKRLMLLATLSIVDAGWVRWLGEPLGRMLGEGFVPFLVGSYLASFALIAGIGVYDLATRRRLQPAYVAGAIWVCACLILGSWLNVTPAWKPVAIALIRL
jgi:hypothetical protein